MKHQGVKRIIFERCRGFRFFFAVSASRQQGPRLVSIKDEHTRLLDENQKMKVSNETLEVLCFKADYQNRFRRQAMR